MKFVFTNLFDFQLEHLLAYIQSEFGNRKAEEVRDKITLTINDIPPFTSKYPLYMIYSGYEIHRIVQKKNYIFYTVSDETLWVLAIFSTRMSPATMRKLVMQQVTSL